jgi:hypothetical protein
VERATHSFLAVPPEPGESHSVRSDRVTLHLSTPQLVFASPLLRIRRGMPAVCFVTAPQAIHGCPIEDSDWAHPLPHLHRGWAHPSTPVLGQGLPYHICTGTGARPGIMIVGTLWLFPGAIAHLVMRTVVPAGAPASEEPRPRISVAVNYTLAPHPAPHPAPVCASESETHLHASGPLASLTERPCVSGPLTVAGLPRPTFLVNSPSCEAEVAGYLGTCMRLNESSQ